MSIDCWASEVHYWRHLEPIWRALPHELRGTLHLAGFLVPQLGDYDGPVAVGPPVPWGDPVLVASQGDLSDIAPRPAIFVEHGSGQAYDPHPSYSGGAERGNVQLYVAPNEVVADRNRAAYPSIPTAVVGCPALDRWLVPRTRRNSEPIVAVAFHWSAQVAPESMGAFSHFAVGLPELTRHYRVLGHSHPHEWATLGNKYPAMGIEPVAEWEEVLARADILVMDNSSCLFEFAATGRPVVVLDAPWYRTNVDYWPRFAEPGRLLGLHCSEPDELVATIGVALDDSPTIASGRRAAASAVYAHLDGRSTERAVAAIVDALVPISAR